MNADLSKTERKMLNLGEEIQITMPSDSETEQSTPSHIETDSVEVTEISETEEESSMYEVVESSEASSVKVGLEDFSLLRVIGKGSYGKVILVKPTNRLENSEEPHPQLYAMKILKKQDLLIRNQIQHTKAERNILEQLNHPFIVQMKYAFQTPNKLHFVLEYCPGIIIYSPNSTPASSLQNQLRIFIPKFE